MNKILAVTGGTGKKSGSSFLRLINQNREEIEKTFGEVRCLVRPSAQVDAFENKELGIRFFKGDFKNEAFLEKAFCGVDTVVHIAGIHSSREIVDAAVKCRVRRLILVHTTGIYSKYKEAGEGYRQINAYVEELCREHGILLTMLMPTMIYGNIYDGNVIQFVKMVDRFPIMPVVNGARYELQPVHFDDLAKAYYDVLMNEEKTAGKDFVLSGGAPILLRDMLSEIGVHLGKKVRFFSCPFFIAYSGAWVIYLLTFKKKDYREKVQRLCEPRVYSHQDATEAFGYSPRTFEEGIGLEVKEYLKQK